MNDLFNANLDLLLFTGATAVKILVFLGAAAGFTALLALAERKVGALVQDRIGPNRAAVRGLTLGGLFQPAADAVKLIFKEDPVPGRAERLFFTLAPVFALVPVLTLFALIPFGDYIMVSGYRVDLRIADLPLGLFFLPALSGLGIYGVFLAGWASKNNFALLGALRGAARTLSCGLLPGLTLAGLPMIYGSAGLQDLVRAQGELLFGFVPAWGAVCQPFAFILFLAAAMAENRRVPFDLAETEVLGHAVEYGSTRFAAFLFAEFAGVALTAMLTATLFFGGWQVPYLYETGFLLPGGARLPLDHYLVSAMQTGAFAAKTLFIAWLLLMLRWTLPRFRPDQLMGLCWKALLPLALLNILLTGAALLKLGKL